MARVEKSSVALTPELASTVRQAVDSGEFASASEVIGDALRQWSAHRALELSPETIADLRLAWHEGLNSGEAQPMDKERIRSRGRSKLETKDQA